MIDKLLAEDRAPCAFIAEPLEGNAGGVRLPRGYLSRVYQEVRRGGGLCICDEVQTGYGRLGSGFWGCESVEHTSLEPDIITVAKAAGNGHPLGFVLASHELLEEFREASGSFFSSAGGGPVSCAIGNEVLNIVFDENLQGNAQAVGQLLSKGLQSLQQKYPKIIGYIHGYGLYQGVEILAADQSSHTSFRAGTRPGTIEARLICRRLLELGVLCHNTGDYSNVLKVKPPLCFSADDAIFFMEALDKVCADGW